MDQSIPPVDIREKENDETNCVKYPCGVCSLSFSSKYQVLRCNTQHFTKEIRLKYKIQNKTCGICKRTLYSKVHVARHIGEKHGATNEIRVKRGLAPIALKIKGKRAKGNLKIFKKKKYIEEKTLSEVVETTSPVQVETPLSNITGNQSNFNIIRNVLLKKVALPKPSESDNQKVGSETVKHDDKVKNTDKALIKEYVVNVRKVTVSNNSESVDKEDNSGGLKVTNLSTRCQKGDVAFSKKTSEALKSNAEYACSFCDYTNKRGTNLKRHIQSKHEGIFYPCKDCDYKGNRKDNLDSHRRKRHGA